MQTDATASHPPVADVSPLQSALSSFVYSDLMDRQIQDQVMAGVPLSPSFGEEFWSGGKYIEGIATSFTSPYFARTSPFPFESPKSVVNSTFEGANCTYQGLPFDGSTRWDFNRGASDHELQESSIMNEWMWTEQESSRLDSINPGPSRFSKELSLSLATSHPPCVVVHGATTIQEQGGGSELSSSGVTSYSLHKRHVGSDNTSCSSNNLSLDFSSCKTLPVATLLSGPRFFQAMQEILAEFARYALEDHDHHHRAPFASSRAAELESDHRFVSQNNISCGKELESKKKNLLSLLQLVDDQYNQFLDEIHMVISAFHVVTELDPNLHTRFALPTVSAMYRNLRERISSHILAMEARQSDGATREDSSFETSFIQQQWALQQLKKRDHQIWRPQRGLPERSVSVLRAWMFQNFLHPYPKDAEKQLLALKSGLTRSQVSNWFINARVRLWKPMIEEMYAEMNRRKALKNQEDGNGSHRNHLLFESRRF